MGQREKERFRDLDSLSQPITFHPYIPPTYFLANIQASYWSFDLMIVSYWLMTIKSSHTSLLYSKYW